MKSGFLGARLCVLCASVGAACSSFAQTQESNVLPEVVVTASRFTESAASLTYAASAITAEDIRTSGATSVNDAIVKMLGLPTKLDTSGGGNYSIDLRGFGEAADRNQVVVVDGRRLRDDDLSATNMAAIPIETIERIEVVRGSGAVQYGEGATGGVIVITTKAGKGSQRTNAASLGLTLGSNGDRQVASSAVLASGGFSVDVAAKDAKNDGFRKNFASTSNSLSGTAQWSNEWLRLGVLSGRQIQQSGWPGSLSASKYAADPTQTNNPNDYGFFKSENSGVFAEAFVGSWQLALDANDHTKQTRSENFGASAAHVKASDLNLRARYESANTSFKNALVLGVDSSQWANTVDDSTYKVIGSIADTHSDAFYITNDLTYVPTGTHLNVGVRADSVKKTETSSSQSLNESPTAWQLGVSQTLKDDLVAYGHIGSSYRLATADEYTFAPANVTLQTQTSRDAELGVRWQNRAGKVELRWYRSELNNEIGFDNAIYRNVNFDPTLRQGVELEVKRSMSASLTGRFNAAYREAKFTSGVYSGNDFPKVPHQAMAIGLTWALAPGQTLDGGINWVSSQATISSNQCTTPSYTTMDASYLYRAGNLELALGVKNLTDAKYYTLAYGCSGTQSSSIYPESGRTVSATARMSF
jgi:iron complex outermembrane receptor protein